MRIAVTGSTGFVGAKLVSALVLNKVQGSLFLRAKGNVIKGFNTFITPTINGSTQFMEGLHRIDCVIHCAARVHVMNDSSNDALEEFREVNTYGTINLAQQAADAGVKRFIFISSVKVNGESTELGAPFSPDDTYVPTDHYGLSKYEAEVGLRKIANETGMEVVIIRPPLVYGPGVKANFATMMKWVNRGLPLPLGGIQDNKRSLVAVDNLVDLIICCIDQPNAANQTFLVSDGDDISTTGLLQHMAMALNVSSRLLPIPVYWFTLAVKLMGKPAISQRLCGSLQVDISKTKTLLNWQPPYSSDECMRKTAEAFLVNINI